MLRRLLLITILMSIAVIPATVRAAGRQPFCVVIDPGHGGRDYGCEGARYNEKTIVLDVALRLGKIIEAEHPDVKIIYTRDTDRFIPLNDRSAIANRAHADLFISIHVNSVDRRNKNRANIHGASVYTLGLHRTEDNLAVAMRENSVIELENDFSETYQGFDPSSSESYIIFELTQNRHQRNSIEFAQNVQNELINTAGRADRGVLQSGFLVLRTTSMPSVLVELDFICNKAAENFLGSDDGRSKCARSLANAFTAYYDRHNDLDIAPAAAPEVTEQPHRGPVTYHVQFLTGDKALDPGDSRFKDLDDVTFYMDNGIYKYICGSFTSLNSAKKYLRKVKKRYPEAFIIKMRDGSRIN